MRRAAGFRGLELSHALAFLQTKFRAFAARAHADKQLRSQELYVAAGQPQSQQRDSGVGVSVGAGGGMGPG